jgi:hypothetical protein
METKTMPFEQAAELLTGLSGWVCKTCRRYWADAERMARWCCATDLKCATDGCEHRVAKHSYVICDACRGKKELERWLKLPEVPWDGETPLCLDDDDTYFFSPEDLDEYLADHSLKADDLRLVICELESKPSFDMHDHLQDYLPEGLDADDDRKINAVVNRWIDKHVPDVWVPSKARPTAESLKSAIA